MLTKRDVFNFLENREITKNDTVAIHCSLKAIGPIENGADGLIDAFCEYLSDGLFIVPTHTWNNVNRANPFFDVRTTVPCIGVLPRIAAFRNDFVRSLHPTHSIAVFGKRARDFVKGEERLATPAPPGSCLSRLYEENGKILLVGVGHGRNTYLHAIDERLNIPNRLNPDAFEIAIKDYDGNLLKSPPFHTHYTKGITANLSDFYPNYKEVFDYFGAVRYSSLGDAKVYVCDARRMTDIAKALWEKADRDLFLRDEKIPDSYYKT